MTVLQAPSNSAPTLLESDTWIAASWDQFLQAANNPEYGKGKFYYYQDHLRIEMSPIGNDHSRDHSIINNAISLYVTLKSINLNGNDNCSYRLSGHKEAQPDLSYYVGNNVSEVPYGTGIVNLDQYAPPDLVVEIANTSLSDDQGKKRLLYEALGVKEYWIVDVKANKVLAFKVENQGSYQIRDSVVLTGLKLDILEEALQKTRQTNHGEVMRWLLAQFS